MRQALHDADGVLLAHGFCEFTPESGQFTREVPDEFALSPREWRWNGADYEPYTPPAPVPLITRAQCLLWLWRERQKTEADVDTAIAAIANVDERTEAAIVWKNARDLHHDHPLFAVLAPALRIALADLPDAFRAAALL